MRNFFRKRKRHERHITTAITNHKRCCLLHLVSDVISQNIVFDVIQSDVEFNFDLKTHLACLMFSMTI